MRSPLESNRRARVPHPQSAIPSRSRRDFLRAAGAAAAVVALPSGATARLGRLEKTIRIGLISDLHQDLMHDGEERMDTFVRAMKTFEADAVMQLGDFAYPAAKNRSVIDPFNGATGNALHVIGNHDTDSGHTKQQCLDVWGMSGRYYARDVRGLRVLALDGNEPGSPTHRGGYVAYVGEKQREWLVAELQRHDGPFLIASHQPLAGAWTVANGEEMQTLLSRFADKIALVVNGHTHIDQLLRVGKVNFLHVNSASYFWVGGDYKHESYAKELHAEHPWIGHTCPYRDPVFSALAFDPLSGTITIEGRTSVWVGPSPAELGVDHDKLIHGEEIAPRTRTRRIERARG